MLNAWLLYRGLARDGVLSVGTGWLPLLVRVALGNAVMVGCIRYLDRPLDWWLAAGAWERSAWLGVIVVAGAASYFLALFVAGTRPSQFGHRGG